MFDIIQRRALTQGEQWDSFITHRQKQKETAAKVLFQIYVAVKIRI